MKNFKKNLIKIIKKSKQIYKFIKKIRIVHNLNDEFNDGLNKNEIDSIKELQKIGYYS